MGKNAFKVICLLVPALCSVGLLSFCLISDLWLGMNQQKVNLAIARYKSEYASYTNGNRTQNVVNEPIAPTTITTTSTSTAFATSAEEQVNDEANDDEWDDSGDYETNENVNRLKRSEPVVDYVFIRRLWPLVKYKSLYSECIEYQSLPLKISAAFLTLPNKEPLVGSVDYGKITQRSSARQCEANKGMVRCLLSQQCVYGKACDGNIDCNDQSDEQNCNSNIKCSNGFQCDNRCWPSFYKCDLMPHCSDMSDELGPECRTKSGFSFLFNASALVTQRHLPFALGSAHFDQSRGCFMSYFDFKSAKLIRKESLRYLSQGLADGIQETNNNNYHLQLIYSLSFIAAWTFSLLSLFSLIFVACFKRLCFQCPFWFYGFFAILAWLSCAFGLMTFLFQRVSSSNKTFDPHSRLPIENELLRQNPELAELQSLGLAFWLALGATASSFIASFVSCIVCCRLPSARHEDKEYKIMQLPTYS